MARGGAIAVSASVLLVGCRSPAPDLTPAGDAVVVNEAAPPAGYERIGVVIGSDGYGCKQKGSRGRLEVAMTRLRNRAAAMGADYVRIEVATAPQHDGTCERMRYVLKGTAYTSRPKPRDAGFGTCFAVRPDGVVLTAAHVVDGAETVEVALEGRDLVPARVLEVHEEADIAALKVDVPTPSFLRLASAGSVALGDPVFTMGYPVRELLGKEPKFTDGSISALEVAETDEKGWMQMTTPVQPGNSGGPVIDESGRVVGIAVATAQALTFLRVTGTLPQGINFAVKSELAGEMFEAPPSEVSAPDGVDGGVAPKEVAKPERRAVVARTKASLCAVKSSMKPPYRAKSLEFD